MQKLNKKSKFLVVSRAAEFSNYHSDYLTQLCRKGQLLCKQISKVWFIDFASLDNYLRQNKKDWSLPYNEITSGSLIDIHENFSGELSIFIDDIEYVNSTKASRISSYNRDYLTQLARSGEILAKKFGKVWFFSVPSLQKHISRLKRDVKPVPTGDLSIRSQASSLTNDKRRKVLQGTSDNTDVHRIKSVSYKYEPESDFEDIPIIAGKQKTATPVSISKFNKSNKNFQIHNYIHVKKHTKFNNRKQAKIKLLIDKVGKTNDGTRQDDVVHKMNANTGFSRYESNRLDDINKNTIKNDTKAEKKAQNSSVIYKKQQIKIPKEVYRSISINYNNSFDKSLLFETRNSHVLRFVSKSKYSFQPNLNFEPFIYVASFILIFTSLFILVLYNLMYYGILNVPARIISA